MKNFIKYHNRFSKQIEQTFLRDYLIILSYFISLGFLTFLASLFGLIEISLSMTHVISVMVILFILPLIVLFLGFMGNLIEDFYRYKVNSLFLDSTELDFLVNIGFKKINKSYLEGDYKGYKTRLLFTNNPWIAKQRDTREKAVLPIEGVMIILFIGNTVNIEYLNTYSFDENYNIKILFFDDDNNKTSLTITSTLQDFKDNIPKKDIIRTLEYMTNILPDS